MATSREAVEILHSPLAAAVAGSVGGCSEGGSCGGETVLARLRASGVGAWSPQLNECVLRAAGPETGLGSRVEAPPNSYVAKVAFAKARTQGGCSFTAKDARGKPQPLT